MQVRLGILSLFQESNPSNEPFGGYTPLFHALHMAAQQLGSEVYVFQPQKTGDRLRGYQYKNNRWEECTFPVPDVIYNRLPTRSLEHSPECQRFLTWLMSCSKGRMFNRCGFFTKSQLNSVFSGAVPAGLQIPETWAALNPQDVLTRLHRWNELWLKPDDGSLGGGIYRLIQEPFGFTVESSDHQSTEHYEEQDIEPFLSDLLAARSYLCQQSITRAEHSRRPYDIRVVLHKTGAGIFRVSHSVVRLANYGQIASNLTAGGDGYDIKEFLTEEERKKLRACAIACANRIDQKIAGPIGELGLDLAIDQYRNFWFIEANSKPFLRMDPASPRTVLIGKRMLEYAMYLKNQPGVVKRNKTAGTTPRKIQKPSPRVSKDR